MANDLFTFSEAGFRALKRDHERLAHQVTNLLKPEGESYRAQAVRNFRLGKLTTAMSAGGSATMQIWAGIPGSEAVVTGSDMTVYDWCLGAIPSTTKVVVGRINGKW